MDGVDAGAGVDVVMWDGADVDACIESGSSPSSHWADCGNAAH